MAFFMFVDESGQDQQESPYEVLAGVAAEISPVRGAGQKYAGPDNKSGGFGKFGTAAHFPGSSHHAPDSRCAEGRLLVMDGRPSPFGQPPLDAIPSG